VQVFMVGEPNGEERILFGGAESGGEHLADTGVAQTLDGGV
jgi:hypothetical protein